MKSTLIGCVGKKKIVKLEKAGHVEWLTCPDYDKTKPEGTKWSSAQYFVSLEEAVKNAMEKKTLYLITINPDYSDCDTEYAVVEGMDMAIDYLCDIKEYIAEENIRDKIKELRYKNEVSFGEYGYIGIEELVFGHKIGG